MILDVTFILLCGIFTRQAGGGLGHNWLKKHNFEGVFPETMFSLLITLYLCQIDLWFLLSFPFVFFGFQTGHGNALDFKDKHDYGRMNTIEPLIQLLARRLNISFNTPAYDRLFMGVKGFIIGLPMGGLFLAFFWPLSYQIREWVSGIIGGDKAHTMAEILTGVFAALNAIAFVTLVKYLF